MGSKRRVGIVCAVPGCSNASSARKDLSFHRFPTDPKLQKGWVKRCRRKANWNPNFSRICSEHFAEDDYERDLKAELLECQSKRRLKPGILPHMKLSKAKGKVISKSAEERNHRMSKKVDKEKHEEIINTLLNTMEVSLLPQVNTMEISLLPQQVNTMEISLLPQQVNTMEVSLLPEEVNTMKISLLPAEVNTMEVSLLPEEASAPKPDFEILYTEVRLQNEHLNEEIISLRTQLGELTRRTNRLGEHASILQKMFTPNEISLLTGKKTHVKWTEEEITKATTLRNLSKRAYVYLRKQLNHPLPGISTLKRCAGNADMKHSILHAALTGQLPLGSTKTLTRSVSSPIK